MIPSLKKMRENPWLKRKDCFRQTKWVSVFCMCIRYENNACNVFIVFVCQDELDKKSTPSPIEMEHSYCRPVSENGASPVALEHDYAHKPSVVVR